MSVNFLLKFLTNFVKPWEQQQHPPSYPVRPTRTCLTCTRHRTCLPVLPTISSLLTNISSTTSDIARRSLSTPGRWRQLSASTTSSRRSLWRRKRPRLQNRHQESLWLRKGSWVEILSDVRTVKNISHQLILKRCKLICCYHRNPRGGGDQSVQVSDNTVSSQSACLKSVTSRFHPPPKFPHTVIL